MYQYVTLAVLLSPDPPRSGHRHARLRRLQALSCFWASAFLLVLTFGSKARAKEFEVLHVFDCSSNDGSGPYGRLLRDQEGNLFGTTVQGGAYGFGTIFKLDKNGTETILYSFQGEPDGAYPQAGLVEDSEGNFYGTTTAGGQDGQGCQGNEGCGVVFELDAAGTQTVLYRFQGSMDGATPDSDLTTDAAGNLYSTTVYGGGTGCESNGCGTIFKLDTTHTESILYRFQGGTDGAEPEGGVTTQDSGGLFYGNTLEGGNNVCPGGYGCGTIFSIDSTGHETVLYRFAGGEDGASPAGLLRDPNGYLYGVSVNGGGSGCDDFGCGTVFSVNTATGDEAVLHKFVPFRRGLQPVSRLVVDPSGTFYGTTPFGGGGGPAGGGTLYSLSPKGGHTVLHTFFNESGDARQPVAALTRAPEGGLYGTAVSGGGGLGGGCGIVFKMVP
jgi:uncharacterized repeat protein (TIGR03803 family)